MPFPTSALEQVVETFTTKSWSDIYPVMEAIVMTEADSNSWIATSLAIWNGNQLWTYYDRRLRTSISAHARRLGHIPSHFQAPSSFCARFPSPPAKLAALVHQTWTILILMTALITHLPANDEGWPVPSQCVNVPPLKNGYSIARHRGKIEMRKAKLAYNDGY